MNASPAGRTPRFRAVVISGASSGLGAALAQRYAGPGVTLGLIGRNRARLGAVAAACRARGGETVEGVLDVGDAVPLAAWLRDFDRAAPVDLLIANAGTSAGPPPGSPSEGLALATRQIRGNLLGAVNMVETLVPALAARARGRIVLVASLAGYRGLPYSPAYSASKAGIRAYGEALRSGLAPHGVRVSVVCPGFFSSPMTDRYKGDHPFLVSLDRATAIVGDGIDCGRRRIVFPWRLAFLLRCADLMPAVLGDAILRHVPFHIEPAAEPDPS
jgi:short-subunit dehydrogenase